MQHATFRQGPFEFCTTILGGVVAFTIEDRGHTSPCFVWQRCKVLPSKRKRGAGYGLYVRPDGKLRPAHRFAYEAVHGPIPAGLVVDHLCRVRACVNPDHLEAVTQARNIRRSIATRLSDRKATEIRRLYHETSASMDALASKFGVSVGTVRKVIEGETWKGLDTYERNGLSKKIKLSDEMVAEMRSLWATGQYLQRDLAEKYSVSHSRVSCLVRGKARIGR